MSSAGEQGGVVEHLLDRFDFEHPAGGSSCTRTTTPMSRWPLKGTRTRAPTVGHRSVHRVGEGAVERDGQGDVAVGGHPHTRVPPGAADAAAEKIRQSPLSVAINTTRCVVSPPRERPPKGCRDGILNITKAVFGRYPLRLYPTTNLLLQRGVFGWRRRRSIRQFWAVRRTTRSRILAGGLWPQGDRHRRAGDARADVDPQQVCRGQAAGGRSRDRLAAHDDPDGRADRDDGGAGRGRALGELQHLLDAGPCGGGDCGGGRAGVCLEGRDAGGVLVVHERGAELPRRQGGPRTAAGDRRRRRRDAADPQGCRDGEGRQVGRFAFGLARRGRIKDAAEEGACGDSDALAGCGEGVARRLAKRRRPAFTGCTRCSRRASCWCRRSTSTTR